MIALTAGFGVVAGLFAGTMAFLITYEEYRKHFVVNPLPALRQALATALLAAAFFIVLAMVAALLLWHMVAASMQ